MFTVSASNGFEITGYKNYKTPTNAIKAWMREEQKHPMDAMISADTVEEVIELRRFVKKYADWFKQTCEELRCPYKSDWLLEQVENPEELHGSEYTMDRPSYVCAPFTVG